MGLYKDLTEIVETASNVIDNVAEHGTKGLLLGDNETFNDQGEYMESQSSRDPDTLSPETFETSYNKMAAGGSTTSTSTPTSPRQPVATPPSPQPIDPPLRTRDPRSPDFIERGENESYREVYLRRGGKLAPEVPDSNPYDGSVTDHNAYAPNKYLKGRTSDFPIPSDQFDIEGATDKELYEQMEKKQAQDIYPLHEWHELYRRRIEHHERTDFNNLEGFAPGQKPGEMPSDEFIKKRKENPLILYGPDTGRLGPPLKPGQTESDRRVHGGQPKDPVSTSTELKTFDKVISQSPKTKNVNIRENDPVNYSPFSGDFQFSRQTTFSQNLGEGQRRIQSMFLNYGSRIVELNQSGQFTAQNRTQLLQQRFNEGMQFLGRGGTLERSLRQSNLTSSQQSNLLAQLRTQFNINTQKLYSIGTQFGKTQQQLQNPIVAHQLAQTGTSVAGRLFGIGSSSHMNAQTVENLLRSQRMNLPTSRLGRPYNNDL